MAVCILAGFKGVDAVLWRQCIGRVSSVEWVGSERVFAVSQRSSARAAGFVSGTLGANEFLSFLGYCFSRAFFFHVKVFHDLEFQCCDLYIATGNVYKFYYLYHE